MKLMIIENIIWNYDLFIYLCFFIIMNIRFWNGNFDFQN